MKNQNYIHDLGELTKTLYIRTQINKTSKLLCGFISGTDRGQLSLLLQPYIDGGIAKYNVHLGAVTCLVATPDNKFVFSASEDGSLFIFKVSDERINPDMHIAHGEDSAIVIVDPPKLMDPELCDIVLVKRDDMESWLSR